MEPTPQNIPDQTVHNEKTQLLLPKLILGVLGVLIITGIGMGGYYLGTKNTKIVYIRVTPTLEVIATPTSTSTIPANWKTYTSKAEKASFRYPPDWVITTPAIQTNYPGTKVDQVGIQSPTGEVKISWVAALGGFGGGCSQSAPLGSDGNEAACSLITVVEKTPIPNIANLFVISGIITRDGQVYKPFLAVQDTNGIISTKRDMGYDMFMGRNNGTLPASNGHNSLVLFSTGSAYADGSSLTQKNAEDWFDQPEVQQAKQILLSLTY